MNGFLFQLNRTNTFSTEIKLTDKIKCTLSLKAPIYFSQKQRMNWCNVISHKFRPKPSSVSGVQNSLPNRTFQKSLLADKDLQTTIGDDVISGCGFETLNESFNL